MDDQVYETLLFAFMLDVWYVLDVQVAGDELVKMWIEGEVEVEVEEDETGEIGELIDATKVALDAEWSVRVQVDWEVDKVQGEEEDRDEE